MPSTRGSSQSITLSKMTITIVLAIVTAMASLIGYFARSAHADVVSTVKHNSNVITKMSTDNAVQEQKLISINKSLDEVKANISDNTRLLLRVLDEIKNDLPNR